MYVFMTHSSDNDYRDRSNREMDVFHTGFDKCQTMDKCQSIRTVLICVCVLNTP